VPLSFQLELPAGALPSVEYPSFDGQMVDESAPSFSGTVEPGLVGAMRSDPLYHWARVKLAGAWLPEEDLAGPVRIVDSIDEIAKTWDVPLRGDRYSVPRTETTWTLTPIEVHLWAGGGDTIDRDVPTEVLIGTVLTCDQADDHGPVVTLRCGDAAAAAEAREVCYELEPGAGWTRGEIVADIAGALGLASAVPDGEVYDKAVQIDKQRGLDWLLPFVEPEGWSLRIADDGATLEAYEPRLAEAPLGVDDSWTPEDWESISIAPPRAVASRWTIRGSAATFSDELGNEMKVVDLIIRGPYAPRVAAEHQDSSGTITPTGLSAGDPVEREVSRMRIVTVTRGALLIAQNVTESRWRNLPHALLQNVDGAGPAGGYDYLDTYLDEDGNGIMWTAEKYGEVSHHNLLNNYDAADNRFQTVDNVQVYHAHLAAVRDDADPGPAAGYNAYIYSDGESYDAPTHTYAIRDTHVINYLLNAETGAEEESQQNTYTSTPTPPGPYGTYYVTAGGTEMNEIISNTKRLTERKTTRKILSSGHEVGTVDIYDGLLPGGGFGYLRSEPSFNEIHSEQQYTRVSYTTGRRAEELRPGAVPIARHEQSPWTRLVSEPLEVVLEDASLEAMFGYRSTVISHEHVQTLAEAIGVLLRKLSRELSHTVSVARTECAVRPGDTVYLRDPRSYLLHRSLVVARQRSRDMIAGRAAATYTLEIPVLAA